MSCSNECVTHEKIVLVSLFLEKKRACQKVLCLRYHSLDTNAEHAEANGG